MNDSLRILNEKAVIHDRVTHLEIMVDDQSWNAGEPYAFAMSQLSMQFPRPILFINGSRTSSTWWTNGARHNPNGPSHVINVSGNDFIRYTDPNGMPHREDGPAIISNIDNKYIEEWRISPGKVHRVGGPATIMLQCADPHIKTWGDCQKLEDARWLGWKPHRFKMEQSVQHYTRSEQNWDQHGRPKREDKLAHRICDDGTFIITIITPTLIPYTYTFIRKREYRWFDENGRLDRSDGPAMVHVYNMRMEDFGNEHVSLAYSSTDSRWYHKGALLDERNRKAWMKKHGIKLREGPPIEHGAFLNEDDEFCFITDYLSHVDSDDSCPF